LLRAEAQDLAGKVEDSPSSSACHRSGPNTSYWMSRGGSPSDPGPLPRSSACCLQKNLPLKRGSGNVRTLREVANLSTFPGFTLILFVHILLNEFLPRLCDAPRNRMAR